MKMNKKVIAFLSISCLIAAIFLLFPQIDLNISKLFYTPEEKFFWREFVLLVFLHNSVRFIAISLTILWSILLLITYITKKNVLGLTKTKLLYLLLVLILGPGLVVNGIFKDNWGRARPNTVTEFGGTKIFTPPFIMSNECEKNCSFVSGDPSVGFYIFALAFAIPARKKLFSSLAMGLGCVYGATRIIQGAHFFSDVIFSGIFTFSVCYLMYLLMLRGEEKKLSSVIVKESNEVSTMRQSMP
jgi:lipid A 4'-phosphatase